MWNPCLDRRNGKSHTAKRHVVGRDYSRFWSKLPHQKKHVFQKCHCELAQEGPFPLCDHHRPNYIVNVSNTVAFWGIVFNCGWLNLQMRNPRIRRADCIWTKLKYISKKKLLWGNILICSKWLSFLVGLSNLHFCVCVFQNLFNKYYSNLKKLF